MRRLERSTEYVAQWFSTFAARRHTKALLYSLTTHHLFISIGITRTTGNYSEKTEALINTPFFVTFFYFSQFQIMKESNFESKKIPIDNVIRHTYGIYAVEIESHQYSGFR